LARSNPPNKSLQINYFKRKSLKYFIHQHYYFVGGIFNLIQTVYLLLERGGRSMRDDWVPKSVEEFVLHLKRLRAKRESLKAASKSSDRKRAAPSATERNVVLRKTDCRCHVCGGLIEGPWQADHVLPHSGGGGHSVDNYLPAHRTCNQYRWYYLPDEFQEILRLGVWLRTQIEKQTSVGRAACESFIDHEKKRLGRRK
jgi:hypothetical protein